MKKVDVTDEVTTAVDGSEEVQTTVMQLLFQSLPKQTTMLPRQLLPNLPMIYSVLAPILRTFASKLNFKNPRLCPLQNMPL